MKGYVAIHMTAERLRAALFGADKSFLGRKSAALSAEDSYVTLLAKTAQIVRELCGGDAPVAVAACAEGIVSRSGEVLDCDLPALVGRPFSRELSEKLGSRVLFSDAATACAAGEAAFGAAKKYDDVVCLRLGARVDCAALFGGERFGDAACVAGHMVVEAGGIPCSCGRRGCFTQYVSDAALVRDTKRAMFENRSSALWSSAEGDPENVTPVTAFACAKAGDEAAQKVVKNYIFYLGEGIANLIGLFRPQVFVLAGAPDDSDYLLAPLRKYVSERLFVDSGRVPLAFNRAALGADAELYGCCAQLFPER